MGVYPESGRRVAWCFWGVVVVVTVLGLDRLVRARRWDRLTLVASVILTGAGLHLVLGPDVLQPGLVRYGFFLVSPSVIAFACLVQSLLIVPTDRLRSAIRGVQVVALLAVGYLLLAGVKRNWFDEFVLLSQGRENLMTLRTEAAEPHWRLARVIARDMDAVHRRHAMPRGAVGEPPRTRTILAEDYWHSMPLEYFFCWKDVDVQSVDSAVLQQRGGMVRGLLQRGGYVVAEAEKGLDRVVTSSFPPQDLRSWRVQVGCYPCVVVHRMRRAEEMAPEARGGSPAALGGQNAAIANAVGVADRTEQGRSHRERSGSAVGTPRR